MSLGNVNIEDVPDDVDIFDEIVMIENRFVKFFIFFMLPEENTRKSAYLKNKAQFYFFFPSNCFASTIANLGIVRTHGDFKFNFKKIFQHFRNYREYFCFLKSKIFFIDVTLKNGNILYEI